jgi:sugar (pentulose or hexulose) kinase
VYALKHILDRIESLVGVQDLITVSAREYENEPWLKLRANIYERPLALLRSTEPTALGAMILASVGIGLFDSLEEAVQNIAGIDRLLTPERETAPLYRRSYGNYQRALDTLQTYWRP